MPEIKCSHGHSTQVSTVEWLEMLDLDQLRHARGLADQIIKKAEAGPRRTVWIVTMGGWNDGWYREEEYEKAADHLLRVFKEKFIQEAKDFVSEPYRRSIFADEIPRIAPFRVTQYEYENVWFPAKEGGA